jgi:thiol-disulfide isomerase/thioredoxin
MHITSSDELSTFLKENDDKVVIIKFSASWCGPCKKLAPLVKKIAESQDKIELADVDIDKNSELCEEYNVNSIPHCVIKYGKRTSPAIVGFKPDKLVDELKEIMKPVESTTEE